MLCVEVGRGLLSNTNVQYNQWVLERPNAIGSVTRRLSDVCDCMLCLLNVMYMCDVYTYRCCERDSGEAECHPLRGSKSNIL